MSSEQHADPAGHAHSPGGHHQAPANFGRAFAIGIALNTGYVLVEAGYGFATGSVALVADAGHNLSDVFGLTAHFCPRNTFVLWHTVHTQVNGVNGLR